MNKNQKKLLVLLSGILAILIVLTIAYAFSHNNNVNKSTNTNILNEKIKTNNELENQKLGLIAQSELIQNKIDQNRLNEMEELKRLEDIQYTQRAEYYDPEDFIRVVSPYQDCVQKSDRLKDEISELEEKIEFTESKLRSLNIELNEKEELLSLVINPEQINSLESDINNLKTELENLQIELDIANDEVTKLEIQKNNIEVEIINAEKNGEDTSQLEAKLSSTNRELDSAKLTSTKTQNKIIELNANIENLKFQIAQAKDATLSNNERSKIKSKIEHIKQDIDDYEKKLRKYDKELSELEIDLKREERRC